MPGSIIYAVLLNQHLKILIMTLAGIETAKIGAQTYCYILSVSQALSDNNRIFCTLFLPIVLQNY